MTSHIGKIYIPEKHKDFWYDEQLGTFGRIRYSVLQKALILYHYPGWPYIISLFK